MLSNREEQQLSFIVKSSARHIGNVHKESEETDLREILGSIIGVAEVTGQRSLQHPHNVTAEQNGLFGTCRRLDVASVENRKFSCNL